MTKADRAKLLRKNVKLPPLMHFVATKDKPGPWGVKKGRWVGFVPIRELTKPPTNMPAWKIQSRHAGYWVLGVNNERPLGYHGSYVRPEEVEQLHKELSALMPPPPKPPPPPKSRFERLAEEIRYQETQRRKERRK